MLHEVRPGTLYKMTGALGGIRDRSVMGLQPVLARFVVRGGRHETRPRHSRPAESVHTIRPWRFVTPTTTGSLPALTSKTKSTTRRYQRHHVGGSPVVPSTTRNAVPPPLVLHHALQRRKVHVSLLLKGVTMAM